MTRYRMKVVDENTSIRAIEDKIAHGLVEELIFAGHNEIKLLRIMKNWKPWEHLLTEDYEDKENSTGFMNFTNDNPFAETFENYDTEKHTPGERKPSAAMHPEDKE